MKQTLRKIIGTASILIGLALLLFGAIGWLDSFPLAAKFNEHGGMLLGTLAVFVGYTILAVRENAELRGRL